MSVNPASETMEILRRAPLEVEQDLGHISNAALRKELKRIMLNTIAELEVVAIRETQNGAPPPTGPNQAVQKSSLMTADSQIRNDYFDSSHLDDGPARVRPCIFQ